MYMAMQRLVASIRVRPLPRQPCSAYTLLAGLRMFIPLAQKPSRWFETKCLSKIPTLGGAMRA